MGSKDENVWKKAQELHDKECDCGSTDISDIIGWLDQARQEMQLFTWMYQPKPSLKQRIKNLIRGSS